MADLSREELRRLARLGAVARLQELRREESAIRQAFPELFRHNLGKRKPAGTESGTKTTVRKRRYRMSAAQKKAVSERMRKYWAARRRQKAKSK